MARTQTPRPSARERLLRAAGDLFYADGYSVSVDAIADHADVAKPTVYAHFASKEALIEAVLERATERSLADLDAELERREGDPSAQLRAPFDLLVEGLPDPSYHGCLCINGAAAFPSPTHPAHRVLADVDNALLERFERLAAGAGAEDPARLARQMLLLYNGIKVQGLVDNSSTFVHDAHAAVTALVGRPSGALAGAED
jgi:AcrR family transcriptional regulator